MKKYKIYSPIYQNKYVHDYDLIIEKKRSITIYTLYYSNNKEWREDLKNTEILSLENNGNTMKIKGINKKMRYDQCFELSILLSVYNKNESINFKIKEYGK